MNLTSVLIVALVLIALIVFVVLARKTWHWANITFVILTFLMGLVATIGLAQVGTLRYKQIDAAMKAEQRAETAVRNAAIATSGAPDSPEFAPDSLRGINQRLSLLMTGRGRVWSGGTVTVEDENIRKFKFRTARPSGEAIAAPLQDVLLYVFADRIIPIEVAGEEGGQRMQPYPVSYIGTVRVTEETPETLTLEPEDIVNADAYADPQRTWSLFEKMPLDRRDTFRPESLDSDSDDFDIAQYRQFLTNPQGFLSPDNVGLDAEDPRYEQLIDRYAFDGLSLGKIQQWVDAQPNRLSGPFEPGPQEVFVKYRFDGKSNKSYQVDANGNVETDGVFTPGGQAVDPALHLGKEVEFQEGDTVLVDLRTATGYQRSDGTQVQPFPAQENVKEVDRIFVREVRDFPYLLASLSDKTAEYTEEIARTQKNNLVQEQALKDAMAQSAERAELTEKLEADNTQLAGDKQAVESAFEFQDREVSQLKEKLEQLESQIDVTHQRIRAAQ